MSTTPQRQPLAQMQRLAERVAGELTGFCERIEIAGSIRRRRPDVGDIDLVILPKPGQVELLKRRCLQNARPVRDGDQEFVCRLGNGTQLDIWIAAPEITDFFARKATNFGSLLLCRTGSVGHNIMLIERAKQLRLRWNPHWGVFGFDGLGSAPIAGATEEGIFDALKLAFVPPEKREVN